MIVGGGTAGAVLAARLSEDAGRRVLLLEAGSDIRPGHEPPDILDPFPSATLNPEYFWKGLTAVAMDGRAPAPYPQARVMGGGSSINGLIALRGVPSDYERWALAGGGSFSWDRVLPYFRKIESDADRDGRAAGIHAICRTPREQWPAFLRATEEAARRAGLPFVPDINEQPGDGFFAMPNALDARGRVTTAQCYLTEAVRARPNVHILSDTQVTRICIAGGRATGVEAIREGTRRRFRAAMVICCGGGIHSPALLLRSGIGPASELASLGIQTVVDLPGVGRNLQNHPYMFFALTLPRGKRMPADLRRFALAGIRSSSGLPGGSPSDLFCYFIPRVSGERYGTHFALVGSALYAPRSRGSVTLRGPDPLDHPHVNFRFMSDADDPPRMVMAARVAEQLLRDPAVAAHYNEAFLLPGALAIRQFNRAGVLGNVLALAAGVAANSPSVLRRALFGRAFRSGAPIAHHGGGRAILDHDILRSVSPMGHPVGSCALGRADDPMSVVDEAFRVHGIHNLFIADASVMPVIPSANTNLPTIMLAELASERIGGGHTTATPGGGA